MTYETTSELVSNVLENWKQSSGDETETLACLEFFEATDRGEDIADAYLEYFQTTGSPVSQAVKALLALEPNATHGDLRRALVEQVKK